MSVITDLQLAQVALTEKIVIPSQPAAVQRVQEAIEERLRAHGYDDRDVFCICTAIEEAVTNAIKHGNQLCPEKCVHISYHVACERCDIQIEDEGNGFDPAELR
ncbi:MAG: ATP-binding protein, partial [Gemmataceae bacterium]